MGPQETVCLITGGSSGLGAATARRLARWGAQVVLADLDAERGEALAHALAPAACFVRADVTAAEEVQEAIDRAVRQFGRLSAVVHCAGILAAARIVGRHGPHDLALFRRVVEVNLTGTFNVLRLAAAAMMGHAPDEEGERGVAILTGSVAACEGQIGQAAYAAAKGGVAAMVLPAARELASSGIRVVAIAPGVFDTPMMQAASEAVRQSLVAQSVFPRRLGRPEEFAQLVQHVLENRMLNGCVLRLDGAVRMGPR
jgi:NAD(P)-dependent dehydrogenase (short-subunit alcohol dehydrogenase family)